MNETLMDRIAVQPGDDNGCYWCCATGRDDLSEWSHILLLDSRGTAVATEYQIIPFHRDGAAAGVLADYLEDNRERWPGVPDDLFDTLLQKIRSVFTAPERNTPGPE